MEGDVPTEPLGAKVRARGDNCGTLYIALGGDVPAEPLQTILRALLAEAHLGRVGVGGGGGGGLGQSYAGQSPPAHDPHTIPNPIPIPKPKPSLALTFDP